MKTQNKEHQCLTSQASHTSETMTQDRCLPVETSKWLYDLPGGRNGLVQHG